MKISKEDIESFEKLVRLARIYEARMFRGDFMVALNRARFECGLSENHMAKFAVWFTSRDDPKPRATVTKYAAISLPNKRIFTPFFETVEKLEQWINDSDCEPLNMFRRAGTDYDIVHVIEKHG